MDKIIFFNGGWMATYNGLVNDSITDGGRYIDEHGFGGEVYNFRDCDGTCYGYVMSRSSSINLSRIVGDEAIDRVDDVLCVFVAKHPSGGRKIVGWYKKATLFSNYMEYTGDKRSVLTSKDDWPSSQVGYYASTNARNATLLSIDERLFAPKVPSGKGGFGQSNVWYADSLIGLEFRKEVVEFILEYESHKSLAVKREFRRKRKARVDVESNKLVETTAINRTIAHYKDLGYDCISVEDENRGWDLECTKDDIELFVEVKGLSQSDISFILTTNEYKKMRQHKNKYRLSVVTNCKAKEPNINIFSYDNENSYWHDESGNILGIREDVSARCMVE
jgi:hypothetical protein